MANYWVQSTFTYQSQKRFSISYEALFLLFRHTLPWFRSTLQGNVIYLKWLGWREFCCSTLANIRWRHKNTPHIRNMLVVPLLFPLTSLQLPLILYANLSFALASFVSNRTTLYEVLQILCMPRVGKFRKLVSRDSFVIYFVFRKAIRSRSYRIRFQFTCL